MALAEAFVIFCTLFLVGAAALIATVTLSYTLLRGAFKYGARAFAGARVDANAAVSATTAGNVVAFRPRPVVIRSQDKDDLRRAA